MINGHPFIKTFKTPGCYYFYDINTNMIIKVTKEMYLWLEKNEWKVEHAEGIESMDLPEEICRMKEKGLLSSKRVKEIIHPANDTLEYFLNSKLRMITLQVTQQCNLCCSYCAYSGNYYQRGHTSRKMSWQTAKKAIDFLFKHSFDNNAVNIGFYGGEPLLELMLVKKCIAYAEENGKGKDVSFTMTTNATLLTDEIIEYFDKHKVSLLVSLDGPQSIHDKSRKYICGEGSVYDTIIKKLEHVRRKYPDYYKTVSFNAVLDQSNDFESVNEFFNQNEIVKDNNIRTNFINSFYLKNSTNINSEKFTEQRYYEIFKYLLAKLDRLSQKDVSKLMIQEGINLKMKIHELLNPLKELADRAHHSGPCIPGVTRLFSDVSGNLFPCERVSECSNNMRIGNLENGFNLDKIRKILNIGQITEKECKNCWALFFCQLCAASADNLQELSSEQKLSYCTSVRYDTEELMKDYCTLRELGYDFDQVE